MRGAGAASEGGWSWGEAAEGGRRRAEESRDGNVGRDECGEGGRRGRRAWVRVKWAGIAGDAVVRTGGGCGGGGGYGGERDGSRERRRGMGDVNFLRPSKTSIHHQHSKEAVKTRWCLRHFPRGLPLRNARFHVNS